MGRFIIIVGVYVLIVSNLRLVFNGEEYDYSDDMLTTGVHLVLHRPEEHPRLIGYDGRNILLKAGTQNVINVRVCYLLFA